METDDRRYFPPPSVDVPRPTAEDLHAWSIYRQNINSELTTSALGDNPKTNALPYGNFALRPHQVDAILHRAKRASVSGVTASSELLNSTNAMTYLKFGLPRVSVTNKTPGNSTPETMGSKAKMYGSRGALHNSSGADRASVFERNSRMRKSRSEVDVRGARRAMGSQFSVIDTRPNGGYHRDAPVRSPSEGDIHRVEHYRSYDGPQSAATYRHSPDRRREFRGGAQRSGEVESASNSGLPKWTSKKELSVVEALKPPENMMRFQSKTIILEHQNDTRTTVSVVENGKPDYHMHVPGEMNGQNSYLLNVPQLITEKYFPNDDNFGLSTTIKSRSRRTDFAPTPYPDLQVRSLSLKDTGKQKPQYNFSAVTFEARGGDLVGIMATSDQQGDDLLQALMNRRGKWGLSLKGAITYNGVNVEPRHLAERAVYAGTNLDFNPNMSLKQTMLFISHLCEPGETNRKSDTKGRIAALIGDLGLSNVAATRVGDLTRSEKQRLNIACQLLVDPDLVLLERPTHNMDIFDTFFLIEYLRQWALRGRIVIITIHPPTFEIFNMLSRVLILSNGFTIYSGKRKDMIPYFESLDYPCPTQKNPADYYLDLVSNDETTPEARDESAQRIGHLSSIFAQRQPLLSELSQPGLLPPKIWKARFLWQVIVLWIRALIFMFPYNLIEALYQIVQSVAMSVMIGVIYFGLPRNQASADDRVGLFYVILTIGIWPMIIRIIQKEYSTKRWLFKDLQDQTYHKGAYLLAKLMYSVPVTAISIGAYIVPVYFMSRLRQDDNFHPFGLYVGMMYLHVLAWRATAKLAVFILPFPGILALPLTVVGFLSFLTSGYPIHPSQIWKPFKWFEWISPTQWAFQELAQTEFQGVDKLDCPRIPVQIGGLPILTSPNCGLENGKDAIGFMNLTSHFTMSSSEMWKPFVAVAIFDVSMFLLAFAAFMLIQQRPVRKSKNE